MPLVGPPVQHHLDPADLLGVGLKSAPDDVALFSLCAVSAPSSLAVEAADRLGQTVLGFLRGDRFNVYTHPERIDLES